MNTLTQNELQFLCKSLKQYFGELSSTSQSFMDSSQETSTIDDQNAAFFDSLLNKKPSQKAVNKVFKVSDDKEYNDDINNEWWRSIPNNPPRQPPPPKPSEFYNQLKNTPLSHQTSTLGQQLGLAIQSTSQSQSQTITSQPQQQILTLLKGRR